MLPGEVQASLGPFFFRNFSGHPFGWALVSNRCMRCRQSSVCQTGCEGVFDSRILFLLYFIVQESREYCSSCLLLYREVENTVPLVFYWYSEVENTVPLVFYWYSEVENTVPLVFYCTVKSCVLSSTVFLHQNNGAVRARASQGAAVIPNQKTRAISLGAAVIGPVAPRPKNPGHTQLII